MIDKISEASARGVCQRKAAAVIFIIFLSSFLMMSAVPVTANASTNGVIYRANVNEIYIEGQPFPVQVQATYFLNGIPQTATVTIYVTIENLSSGQKAFTSTYNVSSGIAQFIYIGALAPGEYYFQGYSMVQGQASAQESMEFLVAPPPVSYSASFISGGLFAFHSNVLNTTGHYNLNYTFTIDVYYQYAGGAAEMVDSYTNVTNLTKTFPNDGQTVVINIMDRYGWLNGMGINPSEGVFSGNPYTYNFGITTQQPFHSVYIQSFVPDVIAVFILALASLLVYYRFAGRRR